MLNFWLVLSARAENRSLLTMNPWGNRPLLISAVGALLLFFGAVQWSVTDELLGMEALSAMQWVASFVVGATALVVVELHKWWGRRCH